MTIDRLTQIRKHLVDREPIADPPTGLEMVTVFALAERMARHAIRVYFEGKGALEKLDADLFECGRQLAYGHINDLEKIT